MDYRLALLTGIDIPVPQCQLTIHPPSIKEIALIGDKDFFAGVQCLCLYKSMFVEDKNVLSDINNFQIFMMIMQEKEAKDKKAAVKGVLRQVFCMKNAPMDQVAFNPAGEKAREIAKKLQRGRERIAAERNDKDSSIFSQYLSTLSVGLHMPLQSLVELTMFQLYDLIERYMLWVSWDLDARMRLAGGKPDESPDNWMKNIH